MRKSQVSPAPPPSLPPLQQLLDEARRFNDLVATFLGSRNAAAPPATIAANGLTWSTTLDCGKVNHANALKAVSKLNAESFQGHADWRLPEIRELLSLVDYKRYNPAIDTATFPDTKSDWYWSSSSCADDPDCAWVVYFGYGYASWHYRYYGAFVRAVRGPSARASQ